MANMSTSTGYQAPDACHVELKIHLLRMGKSQRQLARTLGVSATYLHQVLRGQKAGQSALRLRNRLVELGIPAKVLRQPNKKRAA